LKQNTFNYNNKISLIMTAKELIQKLFLSIIFIWIILSPVFGQAVYLDPQFGNGGVDTIVIIGRDMNEQPWDIALFPDGKILIGGNSTKDYSSSAWTARLGKNGGIDESFGTSGISIINTENFSHDLRLINVQADGKILRSGFLYDVFMGGGFAIYRFDSLGTKDPTFGSDGLSFTSICGRDGIEDLALSKSGKIAAAGYSCEFNAKFTIELFNPDGSPDLNFNGTGYFTSEFNDAFREFKAVEFQSDNKIVAAGDCIASDVSMAMKIYVVRIDTAGHLDEGFGTSGEFSYTADWEDYLHDMAIQKNGKILLCFGSNKILCLNSNGTIDNTFGNNGIVETKVNDDNIQIQCIGLQQDGKIVVAGYTDQYFQNGGNKHILIARYDENGTLDNTFGNNGVIVTPIGSFTVYTKSMVIQPDNRILIAAEMYEYGGDETSRVLLARFLPDATVSIETKQPALSGIIAYPNPADDYIYLEDLNLESESLTWQLFDITGKKINSGLIISDPCKIYTGDLRTSIYLLQVTDNQYKLVKNLRIIKK
jgi:uncharacterized delta-60 repeat protein